jgi:prepilin-type N-terminal cleavage/methylation domain-containing protein
MLGGDKRTILVIQRPRFFGTGSSQPGFTLPELLVVLAVLGLLLILALPALGGARSNSRQIACLNNLRQLGVATQLYVADYQQYPGCIRVTTHTYIWPSRLLNYAGGKRGLFACPAATPTARWDTNLNSTLSKSRAENGSWDSFSISTGATDDQGTLFSYGINDWGVFMNTSPQLGLGGDIDVSLGYRPVRNADIAVPSQMILMGDTLARYKSGYISYSANLDPTAAAKPPTAALSCQVPSSRHDYSTDLVFTDGHTESPLRLDIVSPTNSAWRCRWNNDNQPHSESTWTVDASYSQLDPSY